MWSEVVLGGVMTGSPIDMAFICWVLYVECTHTNNTWFLGRQPWPFQTHCLCQKRLWICDCSSVHLQKRVGKLWFREFIYIFKGKHTQMVSWLENVVSINDTCLWWGVIRAWFLSLNNYLIFIHIVLIKPSIYLREASWTKVVWQKRTNPLRFENLSPGNNAFVLWW